MFARIVTHTPPYVWLLLAYLVGQGVRSLRPRTMSLTRTLLLPAAFIVSGLLPLVLYGPMRTDLLVPWGLGAVLLVPVGYLTGPRILAVDAATGRVTRDGSLFPLVRNLCVFVLQYGIAVAIATHAARGGGLAGVGRGLSGATAGYFLGWSVVVCRAVFGGR